MDNAAAHQAILVRHFIELETEQRQLEREREAISLDEINTDEALPDEDKFTGPGYYFWPFGE